ncbi:MAG: DUF885 family protein [Candidatus Aminicenantes bacterium]|jgi:hypothetical protein
MKKTAFLLSVLMFMAMSTSQLFSQQNAEDKKFQKFLDSYFEAYWEFYPTAATLAGFHDNDDELEDFRERNLEKRHDELDAFNQELVAEIDRQKLSLEFQIDHAMMVDALDRDLIQHEMLLPWEYNPIFYNRIFLSCIRSLFVKEFAPLETRAKNAESRLKDLEKFIGQAKENLKTPAEIYTQTAIEQFPTIMNFYQNELPGLIDLTPDDVKAKLQANLAEVIPALSDYQNFLEKELLPKSTGNFRLLEAHARLVRTTFQNNIPVQELAAQAQVDAKNIRTEMFKVCFAFYKIMDPKFDIENPPANLSQDQLINSVVSHVLDKIKSDHVEKDAFLDKVKSLTGEIKDHLQENQLAELPPDNLEIVSAPPEALATSWLNLVPPAPYETDGTFTLQITPFPEDMEADKLQSLREEYTKTFLPFWVTANVYPGCFVPAVKTNSGASLIRKLYPNKPVLEGWSYMFGEDMVKTGYGNYNLRPRLNQLKFDLRVVINFIIEFQIHQNVMTKDEAVAYMTRVGFFTQGEAERMWDEILLNPLKSAYAYVGLQEYKALEKEYKELKGETFNRREFLSEVLNHGAIPFRFLKQKIIQ